MPKRYHFVIFGVSLFEFSIILAWVTDREFKFHMNNGPRVSMQIYVPFFMLSLGTPFGRPEYFRQQDDAYEKIVAMVGVEEDHY